MKKRRTADQIARMLREADRELAQGLTVPDVCREIGIAQATSRGNPPPGHLRSKQ